MKYKYANGFNFGHWLFQMAGSVIRVVEIILNLITLNLIYFEFPVNWTIYSLKNSDKINIWIKSKFQWIINFIK